LPRHGSSTPAWPFGLACAEPDQLWTLGRDVEESYWPPLDLFDKQLRSRLLASISDLAARRAEGVEAIRQYLDHAFAGDIGLSRREPLENAAQSTCARRGPQDQPKAEAQAGQNPLSVSVQIATPRSQLEPSPNRSVQIGAFSLPAAISVSQPEC
jgi:hypothetical protein